MIIDLSNIPLRVTETDKELYLLKSAKMWSEIKNMKKKHNFIIMPISVYNIIECHKSFDPCHVVMNDDVYKVGDFCGYECYVDLMITDNTIVMSKNKQSMRDNKINSILGISDLEKDLKINVIL